ncbi:MAG: hypothetical protein ACTHU0_24130 [Kofleriaceae bacterium]
MSRSRLVLAGLVVAALAAWWTCGRDASEPAPRTARSAKARKIGPDFAEALASSRLRRSAIPWTGPEHLDGAVTITGRVGGKRATTPGTRGERVVKITPREPKTKHLSYIS